MQESVKIANWLCFLRPCTAGQFFCSFTIRCLCSATYHNTFFSQKCTGDADLDDGLEDSGLDDGDDDVVFMSFCDEVIPDSD